jgi:hypothetical protein
MASRAKEFEELLKELQITTSDIRKLRERANSNKPISIKLLKQKVKKTKSALTKIKEAFKRHNAHFIFAFVITASASTIAYKLGYPMRYGTTFIAFLGSAGWLLAQVAKSMAEVTEWTSEIRKKYGFMSRFVILYYTMVNVVNSVVKLPSVFIDIVTWPFISTVETVTRTPYEYVYENY